MKNIFSSLKSVFRREGFFKSLFIIPLRLLQYYYYKTFKRREFQLRGKSHPYFYHLRNATFLKERMIEIPIAIDLFKEYGGKRILEVGNVMYQYYPTVHDVVDKYEAGAGVLNEDIIDYNPGKKYDLIVTISTMEHVGWDETPREKDKFIKALNHLKELLAPGGILFVSIPVGYSDDVDLALAEKRIPLSEIYFMKKVTRDNKWDVVPYEQVKDSRCDMKYLRANALLLGFHQAK